jgi:hypothetical protein
LDSVTLREEQERKLSPEVKEEREVQRPALMDAEKHDLHTDPVRLVNTGIFSARSDEFVSAFKALKSTSATLQFDLGQYSNHV